MTPKQTGLNKVGTLTCLLAPLHVARLVPARGASIDGRHPGAAPSLRKLLIAEPIRNPSDVLRGRARSANRDGALEGSNSGCGQRTQPMDSIGEPGLQPASAQRKGDCRSRTPGPCRPACCGSENHPGPAPLADGRGASDSTGARTGVEPWGHASASRLAALRSRGATSGA